MSRNKRFTKLLLAMVLIAVFYVVMNVSNSVVPLKNFVYGFSAPLAKALWQSGNAMAGSITGLFVQKDSRRELEELTAANRGLMTQLANFSELQKENKVLREAFELGLKEEFDLEFAQIIGKDYSADSILVDAGANSGIMKGDTVITSQKFLIGKVGNVYDDFSEVILITNSKSSFDAIVLKGAIESGSQEEIYSIVKGQGGFKANLDFVPKEKEISKGDVVETAALGQIFPQGIVVGSIKEVKNSDVDPFQIAELELGYTLQSLDRLYIVKLK